MAVLSVSTVFADAHLVVVNKPADLLSVPGRGPDKQDCVLHRLQQEHANALVVHRLDMATSGLMVFALHAQAQRVLSLRFAQRQVHKRYVAWVHGLLPVSDAWQCIDLPLITDWPNRPRQIVSEQGKPSQTRWRCTSHKVAEHISELSLEPLTGRSHQLRVHLQAIGHPIVGDTLYGPAQPATSRMLLHACELAFDHPHTQEPMRWHSAPDWAM